MRLLLVRWFALSALSEVSIDLKAGTPPWRHGTHRSDSRAIVNCEPSSDNNGHADLCTAAIWLLGWHMLRIICIAAAKTVRCAARYCRTAAHAKMNHLRKLSPKASKKMLARFIVGAACFGLMACEAGTWRNTRQNTAALCSTDATYWPCSCYGRKEWRARRLADRKERKKWLAARRRLARSFDPHIGKR